LIAILFTTLNASSDKVSLQLQWLHQFQFAGYYMAKEKGFYDEAGLEVEILEMKDALDVVKEVSSGNATFGTGRSSLIIDRFKGQKISILAAIFQEAPSVLLTTNTDLKHPKDLKNKKIMVTHDELSSTAYLSMFASQGMNTNSINIQPHSFNLQDLVSGKTDAMACYISNEPYTLSQQNIAFNVINPKTYGYDFYGDLLFTSQNEIQNNPQRTIAFTKASLKGWEYAYEHIEESAKLIYEKYNTQNKTLEQLIYEGEVLKQLAYSEVDRVGIIDTKKIESIAKIYAITGLMNFDVDLRDFVDPLKINTQIIKIGILSSMGDNAIYEEYKDLINHLSRNIAGYKFEIVPLSFDSIEKNVKNAEIDFLIANPSYFIRFEPQYGLVKLTSRSKKYMNQSYDKFGSVIFTRKDSSIKNIDDMRNKLLTSMHPNSCGGYLIPKYELLTNNNFDLDKDSKLSFKSSHNQIIQDVLDKKTDIGVVRSGILEQFASKGEIDLNDFHIINQQNHKNFPLLTSTSLYPEWFFIKLSHASKDLSKKIMLNLLEYQDNYNSWIPPLDDISVHNIHKTLKIEPYNVEHFDFYDVWDKYKYSFIILIISMTIIVILFIKLVITNKKLNIRNIEVDSFNQELEKQVLNRTQELSVMNAKLQDLVSKDYLTGISSRLYFYEESQSAFDFAKRNKMPLSIILFDIDKFKDVNDTYGHDAGDEILKKFTSKIKDNLRQSDIFGRLGGEEFCICMLNTDFKGTVTLANKLRIIIERNSCEVNSRVIHITTSIGVAMINENDTKIDDTIKRADVALYNAKHKGRNQVVTAT
jgi:polar amino acid transport system substrate-binding protein